MTLRYHCFYVEPVGYVRKYIAHERIEPVLELVKLDELNRMSGEYSNVAELRVIWGLLVEFEPAKVVETYRIKQ